MAKRMKSRAAEYNDNQMLLGMVAPRVWCAAEDEPYLKVWAAHSRSKKLLELADGESNNSSKLLLMAGAYLSHPLTDDEYNLWSSVAETLDDPQLMEITDEAAKASECMEDMKNEGDYARKKGKADVALRCDAKAYAYSVLLRVIRSACTAIVENRQKEAA